MSVSVAGMLEAGKEPVLESSIVKDAGTIWEQELPGKVRSLAAFVERQPSNDPDLDDIIDYALLQAPKFTIQGGTTEVLRGIIAELREGERTVLCTTHDLDVAGRIADRAHEVFIGDRHGDVTVAFKNSSATAFRPRAAALERWPFVDHDRGHFQFINVSTVVVLGIGNCRVEDLAHVVRCAAFSEIEHVPGFLDWKTTNEIEHPPDLEALASPQDALAEFETED